MEWKSVPASRSSDISTLSKIQTRPTLVCTVSTYVSILDLHCICPAAHCIACAVLCRTVPHYTHHTTPPAHNIQFLDHGLDADGVDSGLL